VGDENGFKHPKATNTRNIYGEFFVVGSQRKLIHKATKES